MPVLMLAAFIVAFTSEQAMSFSSSRIAPTPTLKLPRTVEKKFLIVNSTVVCEGSKCQML
jgi:hypothetical protein